MKQNDRVRPWSISLAASLGVVLAFLLVAAVPGCSGCRPEDPVAKKKREDEEAAAKKNKKKEKPKDDFEFSRLTSIPKDPSEQLNWVKPGHWLTTGQRMIANNFDLQADLEAETTDREEKPIDVEKTPFQFTMSRPAILPKGQAKHFEVLLPIPRRPRVETTAGMTPKDIYIKSRLRATRGGRMIASVQEGVSAMPAHQFFLTVLSRTPDSYTFLRNAPSVAPQSESLDNDGPILHYRVVLAKIANNQVAIPSHPLAWTTIAYVVWDDFLPSTLSPDQQEALLDWLHWGGQLIVSGPDSLDALKGSFLEPLLPAEKVRTLELGQANFAELNEHWSIRSERKKDPRRLTVIKNQPLVGVELKRHPDAHFLPQTGDLVVERRCGAGRIVVTAFSLDDPTVKAWLSYDNFLNGCLLRRPPRQFARSQSGLYAEVRWQGFDPALLTDPRLVSTLRYFTRDIGYLVAEDERKTFDELSPYESPTRKYSPRGPARTQPRIFGTHPQLEDWHFNGYSYAPESGVAGWNDFSGAADVARRSLKEAAGITIPEASFVLRMMGLYLVVLVPVNWGFFRVLGRVEWAWVAAPVLAMIGAVVVVRMAQLDIGFLRSRTELAVLELQGGYDRGHLTRFTALYSSLSTAYDLTFAETSALALPFSVDPGYHRRPNEYPHQVTLRRDQSVRLSGFQVASNSTGMVHSEQMLKLPGALELFGDEGSFQLRNDSDVPLRGVGVVRRTEAGQLEIAWVGDFTPRTAAPLHFANAPADGVWFTEWENSPITSRLNRDTQGEVNLAGMLRLATQRLELNRGDIRAIGYCEQDLPGVEFDPVAAQTKVRTMVLCHLRRGPLPVARPDTNCRIDFEEDPPPETEDPSSKIGNQFPGIAPPGVAPPGIVPPGTVPKDAAPNTAPTTAPPGAGAAKP